MKNNFPPRSKFEAWVRSFGGTRKLAKTLHHSPSAPQHWVSARARPSLLATYEILKLAKGKLTIKDIVEGTTP